MTLAPIYKSADSDFNHQAAQKAYDLVMKMDEDEARFFTTAVVYDTLMEDISKNQRTLQRHLDRVISKRCERLAKALDKSYINKALAAIESDDGQYFDREEMLAYAGALGMISKAVKTPYDYGYVFDPEHHPRGAGGQFKSKVRYSGSDKPVKNSKGKAAVPQEHQKKDPKQQRAYQEGHAQLSTFMSQFDGGDTDFLVNFLDKDDNIYTQRIQGNRPPGWDPDQEKPISVEARPTSLTAGGAAFGLVSALGGSTERAATTGGAVRAFNDKEQGFGSFAGEWNRAGVGSQNTNERLYGRVQSGSKFLGQVAPVGSHTQMAASFGEFVGRHGPQAEQVLGPTTRKTMYRYRGTEKTPERGLRAAMPKADTAQLMSAEQRKDLTTRQNRALNAARRSKGTDLSSAERTKVAQAVTQEWRRRNANPRQEASDQRARTRVATVSYFANPDNKKMPDRDLYELQLASGHTPPSEGVIIDATGNVVTQAVGYGDDHYLPFNLKNLKGLKGGEYVRTRSVGGPTSEDIYTGLISGARAVTVVSRSGTFTVQFEEDFRGGRRYNQKASRMVGRYEQLLDAVKSEKVKRTSIPKTVHAEILQQVDEEFQNYPRATRRDKLAREQELIAEFKADPYITENEEKTLYQQALKDVTNDPKLAAATVAAKRNKIVEERALNYQLNGAGYKAALDALQEQFPYYLKKPIHQPLRHEDRYETELDRGYVKPRHNRPEGAQAGFFDATITGRGKFSADQADYQNFGVRNRREATQPEGETAPVEQPQAAAGKLKPTGSTPNEAVVAAIETAQDQQDVRTARQGIRELMSTWAAQEGPHSKFGRMNQADLDQALSDPIQQAEFDEAAANLVSRVQATDISDADKRTAKAALTKLAVAKENATKEKYEPSKHRMTVGMAPYKFPGIKKSTPKDQMAKQLEDLDRKHATMGLNLASMNQDQQFIDLLKTMQDIRRMEPGATDTNPGILTRQGAEVAARLPGSSVDEQSARIMAAGPSKIDEAIDDTHQARRLRYNIQNSNDQTINVPSQRPASAPEPEASTPGNQLDDLYRKLDDVANDDRFSNNLRNSAKALIDNLPPTETVTEEELAAEQARAVQHVFNQEWYNTSRKQRNQ